MSSGDLFTFYAPTRIVVGRGSVQDKVPGILSTAGKKGLLVTDRGLVDAGIVAKVTGTLQGAKLEYTIFDRVEENPSVKVIHDCFDRFEAEGCDYLIGVGGGSSMDTAKCTGVLASHGGKIQDHFGLGTLKERIPFLLCIPTTYGTASEVTPYAVVTDDHFKASIGDPNIIPPVGVLDSEMAVALPMPIAAATGMDALTHAIESYVCRGSNPLSEGLALHAIRLISDNLRQAASSEGNYEATEQMLLASTMAGLAFSQTRLGNVHAMSHAVSGHYGVPHGVANAILLVHVMEFNVVACPGKFGDIAEAMGEDLEGLSEMDAAACAVDAVEQLTEDVGIPETLSEAGADPEGIGVLAEDAMKSGNIHVNPRKTSIDDVIRIFEESM